MSEEFDALIRAQRDDKGIHPFDVIGIHEHPQSLYDRFVCPACGGLVFVSERRRVETARGKAIVCVGCATRPLCDLESWVAYCTDYDNRADYYAQVRGLAPLLGMGVTESIGSDSSAYTIIEMKTDRRIVIQADVSLMTEGSGYTEHQEYAFSRNQHAAMKALSKNKEGLWVAVRDRSYRYTLGRRHERRNPHQ
jgi:transcription elongation factor Elf1